MNKSSPGPKLCLCVVQGPEEAAFSAAVCCIGQHLQVTQCGTRETHVVTTGAVLLDGAKRRMINMRNNEKITIYFKHLRNTLD